MNSALGLARTALVSLLLVSLLGACSGDGAGENTTTSAGSAAGSDAFPVTIEHAFGETTVEEEPARVVTWGWGSADAAIALDVVPVAIPFQAYGGNEDGLLPWIEETLAERGVDIPTILPDSTDPPFEAIAAARPDVILAPYSGITKTDYKLLAEIAPTVAYPDQPWTTPWRDTVKLAGKALGRSAQAEELLEGIDARVAEMADAHPEFEGKSVAVVSDYEGIFYVYKPADPRVQFTLDLGFESAPSVDELASGDESFYYELSYEQLSSLTSDVLVSYHDTEELAESFRSSAHAQLMAQVGRGAVAEVVGQSFVASVSPPTALSLTWGLEDYVRSLSKAARAVDGSR